jgi:hypothetical protein
VADAALERGLSRRVADEHAGLADEHVLAVDGDYVIGGSESPWEAILYQ